MCCQSLMKDIWGVSEARNTFLFIKNILLKGASYMPNTYNNKTKIMEIVCNTEYISLAKIQQVLGEKTSKGIVIKYVYILHDLDSDENAKDGETKLKKPHYHIFLNLKESRKYSEVANWFGIPTNFINKIYSKKYEIGCLYAVHANAPDKYQYPVEKAIANFDYKRLVDEYKKKNTKRTSKEELNRRKIEIVNMIDKRIIRPYNLSEYITAEEEVLFSNAIKIAQDRVLRDLANETSRNMKCIYISGPTSAGKTTFAKMICENMGFSSVVAGSERDPFQAYNGQDALIFDDISFTVFSWKELLRISDNHTASLVGSRYHDKAIQCKVIIITTTREPRELASSMDGAEGEDKKQFYRRFGTYYKMDLENIKTYKYNTTEGKYELCSTTANLVPQMMKVKNERETPLEIEEDPIAVFYNHINKNRLPVLDLSKPEKQDPALDGITEAIPDDDIASLFDTPESE